MNKTLINGITELISIALGKQPSCPSPLPLQDEYSKSTFERESRLASYAEEYDAACKFSIVIISNGRGAELKRATLNSIMSQQYDNWEAFAEIPEGYSTQYVSKLHNISGLSTDNELLKIAAEMATGDIVLAINAGDVLKPFALGLCAREYENRSKPELLYCDCEYRYHGSVCPRPFFKPAASVEAVLCSGFYADGLFVGRRLFKKVCTECSSEKHPLRELAVKCFTTAKSLTQISSVLLSVLHEEPSLVNTSELSAYNKHSSKATPALFNGKFAGGLQYRCNTGKASVRIIIHAKAELASLQACLDSIDSRLTYKHCGITIVSAPPLCNSTRLNDYLRAIKRNKAAEVVYAAKDMSVPELLNLGADVSAADALVFVDPNAVIKTSDFVERLLEPLCIKGVGACGGKLYDISGMLLHTGQIIGLNGWCSSLYKGTQDDNIDEMKCFYTAMQRGVSAVDGRFMAVNAAVFRKAGKFDASLSGIGWDVGLCLAMTERGSRCVYTPFAEAVIGKTCAVAAADKKSLERYYDVLRSSLIGGDPYYSARYDCSSPIPSYAVSPPSPITLNPLYN